MIDAIGEAAMHATFRTNYSSVAQENELVARKNDQMKAHRPVEKSNGNQKSDMNLQYFEEGTTTKNNLEDGRIIVEKYDEDGKLLRKTPPGYLPLGETA